MKRWAIGIDVGATKIATGLVELESGRISQLQTTPSAPGADPGQVAQSLAAAARVIVARADAGRTPVEAVGIGVPEIVSPSGHVTSDQSFPLLGGTLASLPGVRLPVIVESDVRAAACAEARFGAGADRALFLYVSLGSGVSSAVVIDGRPLVGAHGAALVLTSGTSTEWGDGSSPRRTFSVEAIASGVGLRAEYHRRSGDHAATTPDVLDRWRSGDEIAVAVVDRAALLLGQAIARAVDLIDPECVVIGGGLGIGAHDFRDAVVTSMRRHVWLPAARDVPVATAGLGPHSGVVGAALAAADRLASSSGNGVRFCASTSGFETGALPSNDI